MDDTNPTNGKTKDEVFEYLLKLLPTLGRHETEETDGSISVYWWGGAEDCTSLVGGSFRKNPRGAPLHDNYVCFYDFYFTGEAAFALRFLGTLKT